VITYRATLDVPIDTLRTVTGWLREHRRHHDQRPWQRAATVYVQAVMVLRWFKDDTDLRILAHDAGVSTATAYRYLHEGIDVIAVRAPELADVLAQALREGWQFVCLDGTLIATNRCTVKNPDTGHDLWYSGKHKQHGGNVQVLCGPGGYPEWVAPVEPGSTHDITAARTHVLPALYLAAALGLPTLTDKGYQGAGIGILVPSKGRGLAVDNRARNTIIAALRAPAERGKRAAQTDLESAASRHPRAEPDHQHHRRRSRTPTPSTRLPVRNPQCGVDPHWLA